MYALARHSYAILTCSLLLSLPLFMQGQTMREKSDAVETHFIITSQDSQIIIGQPVLLKRAESNHETYKNHGHDYTLDYGYGYGYNSWHPEFCATQKLNNIRSKARGGGNYYRARFIDADGKLLAMTSISTDAVDVFTANGGTMVFTLWI